MPFAFDEKNLKKLLKGRLSPARYEHSLNVAVRARELSDRYHEDSKKAYFTGLMHDICKNDPPAKQLAYLQKHGVQLDEVTAHSPQVYHAVSGSVWLAAELNVQDEEILNAVRYHTTARAGMSRFEEIIYLADLTSAERDYPDAAYTHELVDKSLEAGLYHALRFTIISLVEAGRPVCADSFAAYNYYLAKTQGGSGT